MSAKKEEPAEMASTFFFRDLTPLEHAVDDVNTLVDIGADPSIIDNLEEIYTGVGKKKTLTR
jgi:hypothetical protein